MNPPSSDPRAISERERLLYNRAAWRLVPLLFLGYVVAYLNRVNVGFAKLEMMSDLKFSDTIYGLGAGIFFIGYFFFEVPSNILLHKLGARVWIARIMITWGLISAATMFVTTPMLFYVSRFALGVAEAGFFPGIILYFTYWFPSKLRARIVAFFMSGIAVSGILGGPLSGWIMRHLSGWHHLSGWQWLFVLEAAPAVIMGILTWVWLPNSIGRAPWLTAEEKAILERAVAEDNRGKVEHSLRELFVHPLVWAFSAIYFAISFGIYGIGFWMPQIIRNSGVASVMNVGLLSAIPYSVAAIAMIGIGRHSDQSDERLWHCLFSLIGGTVGAVLIGLSGGSTAVAMLGLILAASGILSAIPLFWTFPAALFGGMGAAAGIALINSIGNLAGFACPYAVGALNDATGSPTAGLYVIAGGPLVAIGLVFAFLRHSGARKNPAP